MNRGKDKKEWQDNDHSAKKARKSIIRRSEKARRHEDKQRLDGFLGDVKSGRKDYDDYCDEDRMH